MADHGVRLHGDANTVNMGLAAAKPEPGTGVPRAVSLGWRGFLLMGRRALGRTVAGLATAVLFRLLLGLSRIAWDGRY